MGELTKTTPMLRIWAGGSDENEYDTMAVIIYRWRLPGGVSFEEVRRNLLGEIENIARNSPYSYWVSPKARSLLNG